MERQRQATLAPTSGQVVREYFDLDREVKALEAQRDALKPAAQAALIVLGGEDFVPGVDWKAKYIEPVGLVVDLDKLHRAVPALYPDLIVEGPNREAIEVALTDGRISRRVAQRCIKYERLTAYIRFTPLY